MLRLFRTIRKKLIEEDKIRTYLLYAIGEILLVVIGILIALQINNWNEERKNAITEQKILAQLKIEYLNNLDQLDEKVQLRNQAMEAAQNILDRIDERDTTRQDRFYRDIWSLLIDPTFDPIKNDIIGTDNLRIIKNDRLVRLLSNWTTEVFQVQELELAYLNFRNDVLLPATIRNGLSRNTVYHTWKDGYSAPYALNRETAYAYNSGASSKTINMEALFDDRAFEGEVATVFTFHLSTNLQSEALRERIELILKLIEQELN